MILQNKYGIFELFYVLRLFSHSSVLFDFHILPSWIKNIDKLLTNIKQLFSKLYCISAIFAINNENEILQTRTLLVQVSEIH